MEEVPNWIIWKMKPRKESLFPMDRKDIVYCTWEIGPPWPVVLLLIGVWAFRNPMDHIHAVTRGKCGGPLSSSNIGYSGSN